MKARELFDADARFAIGFSGLSRSLKWSRKISPWLDKKYVGANTVPEGWQRLAIPADEYDDFWTFVPGDPDGTKLPIPSLYRRAARLVVDRWEMMEARDQYDDAREAIALRFGDQVVVGAAAAGRQFPVYEETEQSLLAVTRLAHGPIEVAAGPYSPSRREFTAVSAYAIRSVQLDALQMDALIF